MIIYWYGMEGLSLASFFPFVKQKGFKSRKIPAFVRPAKNIYSVDCTYVCLLCDNHHHHHHHRSFIPLLL